MRVCKTCKQEKPLTSFSSYRAESGREFRRLSCKDCNYNATKIRQAANPIRTKQRLRVNNIKWAYGITADDVEQQLIKAAIKYLIRWAK